MRSTEKSVSESGANVFDSDIILFVLGGGAFLQGERYVIIIEMRFLRKMIGVPICNPLERLLERFE